MNLPPRQRDTEGLKSGDRVLYIRAGDFGGPLSYLPAVYLRTTPKGMCEIRLDTSYRSRYVKPWSLRKDPSPTPEPRE